METFHEKLYDRDLVYMRFLLLGMAFGKSQRWQLRRPILVRVRVPRIAVFGPLIDCVGHKQV